ncbi:hypothetical protein JX265_009918 [Neoarthrinium moseri]|uniref:Amidohydrolase-related domain-containing protein n=1 Tax=Neoarthrinium moseri TaxID=1658444 RepID=A0A9P9WFM0_9PEZI|nr:hypothetical protein JX265_009918 [Neoarthrinium moseri]
MDPSLLIWNSGRLGTDSTDIGPQWWNDPHGCISSRGVTCATAGTSNRKLSAGISSPKGFEPAPSLQPELPRYTCTRPCSNLPGSIKTSTGAITVESLTSADTHLKSETMSNTPAESWDCHVHVFDPARFPFRRDRAYTPSPAPVDSLQENTQSTSIVLVQASPEDGHHGLVTQLREAREEYPGTTFRASIMTEDTPERDVARFSPASIDALHALGVRSIRLQGSYNSFASRADRLKAYLSTLARSYPVSTCGWSISMQMDLAVWSAIHDFLADGQGGAGGISPTVKLVAEHGACARPSDVGSREFQSFLALLRTGRVYVKISALYRRAPGNFRLMRDIVKAYAQAAPERILWGSDWPHVDASKGGLEPTPHEPAADWRAELDTIREWLTEQQFFNMLVTNPARLYH